MSNINPMFSGQRPAAIMKYCGEQDPRHKGFLVWTYMPFGLPLRLKPGQPIPKLESEELFQFSTIVADWWHDLFDMSKESDRQAYQWIQDRIANGWFVQVFVERKWNDETKNYHIYLEWVQLYSELTKDVSQFV
jgi:hypothetical protein